MAGNLVVVDRVTREQGRLFQCMKNGRVKVLMESGEVREYLARDLIGTLETSQPHMPATASKVRTSK